MDAIEAERMESSVITVEQLIDICLSPFHIDVNLLHTLLNIIASKLNLQSVRIHLAPPGLIADINNLITKSKETFEAYRISDGGNEKPFKLALCKLEKINIEPDIPVDTFYKIIKHPHDAKDFHRVTFFKGSPITQDIAFADAIPQDEGYTYAELLNMVKRLEGCEVGIEKLTQLLQKLNFNYKDLERSFSEITSKDNLKKQETYGIQDNSAIDGYGNEDSPIKRKENTKELRYSENAMKDISRLQKTTTNLTDQVNNLFASIASMENLIQSLKHENESKRKALEKPTDGDKLDSSLKEICKMQKSMAQFSDKIYDLIACSNKNNQRFISINDQLGEIAKFRSNQEKISKLCEESTKNLASEFDNFTELYEQIKVFKADREELDFISQCKADKDQLLELVPLDVFNAVKTDLSKGIVQAFDYIMQVEMNVRKNLEEVMSRKLQEKLDKSEKLAITKFVNDKLSCFQGKISDALGGRFDVKSTRARTRVSKDANYICCASEADIECSQPSTSKLHSTKHVRNISPELPESRKRNCGGSHTVLNAEQKISQRRTGRVYSQQNTDPPDLMAGTSGMMYRIKKPECICHQEKFPKILYASSNTEIKEKKVEL